MSLKVIQDILTRNGCECDFKNKHLELTFKGKTHRLSIEDHWLKLIDLFICKRYVFNLTPRFVISDNTIEAAINILNQDQKNRVYSSRGKYHFKSNDNKNTVTIDGASNKYAVGFLLSEDYDVYFNLILKKKLDNTSINSFKQLLWFPYCATFSSTDDYDNSRLKSEGMATIEACLYQLASDQGICWDFNQEVTRRIVPKYSEYDNDNLRIPFGKYDSNMLKFFKVALSCNLPSQAFLSYYHVLEYNFLTVSEEELQQKIKVQINSSDFSGSNNQINKIINTIKKHTDRSDETEMLQRVLKKFIIEDDLIEFIKEIEQSVSDNVYTKPSSLFGEKISISTANGHVIPNTAKLIKHIRNALVHSSDKYNREDCHIPLTISESKIENYLPIMRFLADKVICGTSL